MISEVKWKFLVGKTYWSVDEFPHWVDFYGVDGNSFCIGFTYKSSYLKCKFEVVEDKSDGYRSALKEIKTVPFDSKDIFSHRPIVQVHISEDRVKDVESINLKDAGGHVWLSFGTDYSDNFYPIFIFKYSPEGMPRKVNINPPIRRSKRKGTVDWLN